MSAAPKWSLRPMLPSDIRFVVSTWVRSQELKPGFRRDNAYAAAERLVEREQVWVACSPRHEGAILGWACGFPRGVHYVFVRWDFRRKGIGASLVRKFFYEHEEETVNGDIKG